MKVLGRIFLNSRKERRKDGKTERRNDGKTERRKDGKTERRSFFVRCRRTYVLNNTVCKKKIIRSSVYLSKHFISEKNICKNVYSFLKYIKIRIVTEKCLALATTNDFI